MLTSAHADLLPYRFVAIVTLLADACNSAEATEDPMVRQRALVPQRMNVRLSLPPRGAAMIESRRQLSLGRGACRSLSGSSWRRGRGTMFFLQGPICRSSSHQGIGMVVVLQTMVRTGSRVALCERYAAHREPSTISARASPCKQLSAGFFLSSSTRCALCVGEGEVRMRARLWRLCGGASGGYLSNLAHRIQQQQRSHVQRPRRQTRMATCS